MWFEVFQDSCRYSTHPWRWRLRESSGEVVATSAAGYPDEEQCRDSIRALKCISPKTPVETRKRILVVDISNRRRL